MHATKPNREYYAEILDRIGVDSADAIMVGDNWENDIKPAAALGLDTFWVNDLPVDPPSPNTVTGSGSLTAFHAWLQNTVTVRRSRYKWGSIIWLLTGWLVACATTSPPESTPTVPPTAPIAATVLPTELPATATPIPATAVPTPTLTPTPIPTNPRATAPIESPTVIPTPMSVRFAVNW